MLTPHKTFTELQNEGKMTALMALQEEMKTLPLGAVWEEFCERSGVPSDLSWLTEIEKYEKEVLLKRI